MGVQNGRIPATQLTTILDHQRLLHPAARAVNTLVQVGKLEGIRITCPQGGDPGLSAYREIAIQQLFLAAEAGDRVAAKRCNIDPHMVTNLGRAGSQSHGWGDRIDLLFNGQSPTHEHLALVARYGGVQEFGNNDRNHMYFRNPRSTIAEMDKNIIVARALNRADLGKTTTTETDGVWPAQSNFSWLLQEYGSRVEGWYPSSRYHVDGERGPRTIWVRDHLFTRLWNS